MFITVHSAIGVAAVTALGVHNPVAAFALGWALHYVGDAIPHGDERLGAWAIRSKRPVMIMAAIFAVDFLMFTSPLVVVDRYHGLTWAMLAAAVGATVPDLLMGFEMVLGRRILSPLTRFHVICHKSTGFIYSLRYGLPAQAVLALVMWMLAA